MKRRVGIFLCVTVTLAVILGVLAHFVVRPDRVYNFYSSLPSAFVDLPLQQSFVHRNLENASRLIKQQIYVAELFGWNESHVTNIEKNIGLLERNSISGTDFHRVAEFSDNYLSHESSDYVRGIQSIGILYAGILQSIDGPNQPKIDIQKTRFTRFYDALSFLSSEPTIDVNSSTCDGDRFSYYSHSRQKDNYSASLPIVYPKLIVENYAFDKTSEFSEVQPLSLGLNQFVIDIYKRLDSLQGLRLHFFAPPGTIIHVDGATLESKAGSINLGEAKMFLRSGFFINDGEFMLSRPSELLMFLSQEKVQQLDTAILRLSLNIRRGRAVDLTCD